MSDYQRLKDKLHEMNMSVEDITEFIRLKEEIDVFEGKRGFHTGSNRRARHLRYDKQGVILEKYR